MPEAANFGVVQILVAKRQQVRAGFRDSGLLLQAGFFDELVQFGLG